MHDQGDAVDSKLTRTKLRFAEERRFLTGHASSPVDERLPPGQSWVKGFPVLDLGIKPEISSANWELKIFGAVTKPIAVTWAELMHKLPQAEVMVDIHCVTTWWHLTQLHDSSSYTAPTATAPTSQWKTFSQKIASLPIQ